MIRLLLIALLFIPSLSFGTTTWFFTSAGGTSTKDGTSYATAYAISSFNTEGNWATPKESTKIGPGDTVYICGAITRTSELTPMVSGSAGAQIVIRGDCSTQGGTDAVIDARRDHISLTWTDEGTNRWSAPMTSYSTNPERVWFTKSGGSETEGQQVFSIDDVTVEGRWFYDTSGDKVVVYATSSPNGYYTSVKSMAGVHSVFRLETYGKDYLTLRNMTMKAGNIATIYGRGASHNVITYNSIGYGNIGIYISGHSTGYIEATGNEISYNTIDSRYTLDNASASVNLSDGIKLMYGFPDTVISYNTIKNWGHGGIYMHTDSSSYDASSGILIHHNDISAPDVNYCYAIDSYDTVGKLTGAKIYKNVFHDLPGPGIVLNGDGTELYYNKIYNITGSDRTGKQGVGVGIRVINWVAGQYAQNIKVYNNVVYNTKEAGFQMKLDCTPGECTQSGHDVRNNLFYDTAKDSNATVPIPYGFYVPDSTYATACTFSNNLVYSPSRGANEEFSYRGTAYISATFNAADAESDTIASNLQGDPWLRSALTYDFVLLPSSPAINTGATVGLISDYDDISVPLGGAVDIGIYEHRHGQHLMKTDGRQIQQ